MGIIGHETVGRAVAQYALITPYCMREDGKLYHVRCIALISAADEWLVSLASDTAPKERDYMYAIAIDDVGNIIGQHHHDEMATLWSDKKAFGIRYTAALATLIREFRKAQIATLIEIGPKDHMEIFQLGD